MEDNPPPENDHKLRDRLQDYHDPEGDFNKMSIHHNNFEEEEEFMKKWMRGFGLKDQDIPDVQTVNLLMEVRLDGKISKDHVNELV